VVNYAAAKSSHDVLGIALEALQDPHQGSYNFGSMYNASSYKPDASQYKQNPQQGDSTDHFPYQPSGMQKDMHSDLVGGNKNKREQDRSGFGTGYSSELNRPMSEQDRAQKEERQKRERGDDWQTGTPTGKLHDQEINERKLRERDLTKEQGKANRPVDYRERQPNRDPTDEAAWPSTLSETRDRELRERKEYEKKERVEVDKGWRSDVTGSLNDSQQRRERLDNPVGDSRNPSQQKPEQPWKPSQMERDPSFYKQTPTGSDYTRPGSQGDGKGINRPGATGGSTYSAAGGSSYGAGGVSYGGSGGQDPSTGKDIGRTSTGVGTGTGMGTGNAQKQDRTSTGTGMGTGNVKQDQNKDQAQRDSPVGGSMGTGVGSGNAQKPEQSYNRDQSQRDSFTGTGMGTGNVQKQEQNKDRTQRDSFGGTGTTMGTGNAQKQDQNKDRTQRDSFGGSKGTGTGVGTGTTMGIHTGTGTGSGNAQKPEQSYNRDQSQRDSFTGTGTGSGNVQKQDQNKDRTQRDSFGGSMGTGVGSGNVQKQDQKQDQNKDRTQRDSFGGSMGTGVGSGNAQQPEQSYNRDQSQRDSFTGTGMGTGNVQKQDQNKDRTQHDSFGGSMGTGTTMGTGNAQKQDQSKDRTQRDSFGGSMGTGTTMGTGNAQKQEQSKDRTQRDSFGGSMGTGTTMGTGDAQKQEQSKDRTQRDSFGGTGTTMGTGNAQKQEQNKDRTHRDSFGGSMGTGTTMGTGNAQKQEQNKDRTHRDSFGGSKGTGAGVGTGTTMGIHTGTGMGSGNAYKQDQSYNKDQTQRDSLGGSTGTGMGSGNSQKQDQSYKDHTLRDPGRPTNKDQDSHIRNDPSSHEQFPRSKDPFHPTSSGIGEANKQQSGAPGAGSGMSMPGDFNRTDRKDDRYQRRDEEFPPGQKPGATTGVGSSREPQQPGATTGMGSSRDSGFERVPQERISGNDMTNKVEEPDAWQHRKSQHASASGQQMNDPFGAPYGLEGGVPKGAPYSASVTAKSALEKTKEVAGSVAGTVMEKAGTVMEKAETVLEKVVEGTGRLVDETKRMITGHKSDKAEASHDSSQGFTYASSTQHGASHHTGYRITKQHQGDQRVSLVLHALDISHPHQMVDVFPAWRDAIHDLPPEARVVIVHRSRHSPPDGVSPPTHAAAVEGLHGFAAAAAKEVGTRGITINTLSLRGKVDESVAPSFMEPLAFLLTDQCSYVDCQTLEVFTDVKVDQASLKTEKPLSGKVAVVTGGARGIGESIVHRFEEEGAEVCAVDLPGTLSHYHYDTRALEKDITAVDAPNKLVDHLHKHFGKIDIMVHNAGINMEVPMDKMSHDDYERVVQVNMESILKLDEAIFASKGLVAPGSRWMFMSAISGLTPYPYQTNYGYSKAAMLGYSRAMSKHRPVEDMTVNVIAPGYIDTDMSRQASFVNRNVTKRMNALMQAGQPEDVASAAAFLATPGAQGINGQVLRVCGGSLFGR